MENKENKAALWCEVGRLIAMGVDDPEVQFRIGSTYMKLGEKECGCMWLEKAAEAGNLNAAVCLKAIRLLDDLNRLLEECRTAEREDRWQAGWEAGWVAGRESGQEDEVWETGQEDEWEDGDGEELP